MNIKKITYQNPEHTVIEIETDGATFSVPLPCHTWHNEHIQEWLSGGNIIEPFQTDAQALESAMSAKRLELRASVSAAIQSGIQHDALGAQHSYPTQQTDQLNLTALVTAEKTYGDAMTPVHFWCADAAGDWARRAHTGPQIEAVGMAVMHHVQAQQGKYEGLLGQLAAAQSIADVEAITW